MREVSLCRGGVVASAEAVTLSLADLSLLETRFFLLWYEEEDRETRAKEKQERFRQRLELYKVSD